MATHPGAQEQRSGVLFTAHYHQILSNCIHLLGVTIISYCLAHRLPPLLSWRHWVNLAWGRLCVILVLFDSWLFIFSTGILVNGVGLSSSHKTCALAIYACISFYVMSKVLIYGFLVEKVYIVWSGGNQTPRFSTPAYRICAVVLLGYLTVVVLMIVGKISSLREDRICIIGLKKFATVSMITYDLFLNVFLTAMFLWPLRRSNVISHKLRKIATRTLYGALVSLTTSAVNIIVLLSMKGEEYGWVCLASCVTDVALNAMALSWVTASSYSRGNSTIAFDRYSLPTLDVGPLYTLAQNEYEEGKHSFSRSGADGVGSVTIQTTTLNEGALSLPDSFYDYIPRDQLLPPPQPAAQADPSKRWLPLRTAWRCTSQPPSPTTPAAGTVDPSGVQSIPPSSENITNTESKTDKSPQRASESTTTNIAGIDKDTNL